MDHDPASVQHVDFDGVAGADAQMGAELLAKGDLPPGCDLQRAHDGEIMEKTSSRHDETMRPEHELVAAADARSPTQSNATGPCLVPAPSRRRACDASR